MSFLLRRNRPLAFAGWEDNFERDNENPIQRPWSSISQGPAIAKLENGRVNLGQGYFDFNSGLAYEHSPFTSSWGFEFTFQPSAPIDGAGAQAFQVLISETWAKIGASFVNTLSIYMQYRIVGHNFNLMCFPDALSVGPTVADRVPPTSELWDGSAHTMRVWIDNDREIRLWLDGKLRLAGTVPDRYAFGPNKRSPNFNNQMFKNMFVDTFKLYDRISDRKFMWKDASFYDNFNRNNSSTIGNGWVKYGRTGTAISSQSLAYTALDDNPSWVNQQSFLMPSGDCRIAVILGGARSVQNTESYMRYQRINARINPARTNFLSLWFSREKMALTKGNVQMNTTAYPSPSGWTLLDDGTNLVNLADGDEIALCIKGNDMWCEHNGKIVMGADITGLTNPATDNGWGLGLDRSNFGSSGSFNSVSYQEAV